MSTFRRFIFQVAPAAALLLAPPVNAQDRLINADPVGTQLSPRVVVLGDGTAVFAWSQDFPSAVEMRRFDSAGFPIDALDVEISTGEGAGQLDLAASVAGEFVAVWREVVIGGGAGSEILGRRFAESGAPLGDVFRVNEATALGQLLPSVAMRPDGSFLVAWANTSGGGTGSSISARRFDPTGAPIGGDFAVSTGTAAVQTDPDVAFTADGGALITWASESIQLRRYDSAGAAVGSELTVSDSPLGLPPVSGLGPAVAASDDGSFLVSWTNASTFQVAAVSARVFDPSGTPVAGELVLDAAGNYLSASAAAAVGDEFEVVWASFPNFSFEISSRRIGRDGQFSGPASRINVELAGSQRYPALAVRDGQVLVAWTGPEPGLPPNQGIVSNLMATDEIFADGFEGGDFAAWDVVFP
ncbi:MAG: hypothetical protein AAGM22_16815 [Acidobacteriota bacterium]